VLTVEPLLVEKYVRSGQLKLEFRDVLNHGERSVRTSEAAACAGKQGKFWDMHAVLFEKQNDSYATPNEGLVALMQQHAQAIGVPDLAAFADCMNNRTALTAIQSADAAQRTRGITSQPIFEIGDQRLFGFQSVERMSELINTALQQ
jgi:protein-disulfide isomerase